MEKQARKRDNSELDRIVFFSDAIIAIAITLMVLDIRVPDDLLAQQLPRAIFDLWPKYLSYVLSFIIIAIYWIEHHRMFRYIVRYDGRLMWLNLLFLMFIAFVPFSTDLIGEYGEVPAAVMVYAAIGAAVGLSKAAIWWYASHNGRLLDPSTSPETVRLSRAVGLVAPVVFLASIGIAQFSEDLATWSWIAIIPLIFLVHRLAGEGPLLPAATD